MPKARALEPCSFWAGYGQATFAQGDMVDGDLAVRVLADASLPFEELHDDDTPTAPVKKPRAKKTAAPAASDES